MDISFIVLTYNRVDALLAVLQSLALQCGPSHEVLIADDGSNLEAVKTLLSQCPRFHCTVRHVWHPDTGFTAAKARNQAAKIAQGKYLVFIDGDCVPNRHFTLQHQKLAEKGFFVNGSRVLLSQRFSEKVVNKKISLSNLSAWDWMIARLAGSSNKLLHFAPWPWRLFRVKPRFALRGIRSCNFGVWKADFFLVNGFDESFSGWGHEDADLALRLHHAGLKRKNGFMATEVFHLWHTENARDHALSNWSRVTARMQSRQVRSDAGLDGSALEATSTVTFIHS